MKILMLADSLGVGGMETHIETLVSELSRLGAAARDESPFLQKSDGKRALNSGALPFEVLIASSGGKTAQALVSQGFYHASLPSPERAFASLFAVARLIFRHRPTLVHAHTRRTALFSFLPCRLLGIPLAVTFHARFSMRFPKNLLTVTGDLPIAVSEDVKDHLAAARGPFKIRKSSAQNGVTVIKNGVKIPDPRPRACENPHRIVFVSRLDRDCSLGAELLCEIAPRLAEKYPNAEITIVGGGEKFPEIKQKSLLINKNINRRLINAVGNADCTDGFLDGASLFVGVSRAALEAMARGLPVILLGNEGSLGLLTEKNLAAAEKTNLTCRGFCELEGEDALLFEVERFFGLSEAERIRLSELSRRTAEAEHSAQKMARETYEAYRKCLLRCANNE